MSETFPKSVHLGKENERINQNLSSLVKNIRDPQNITLKLQTAVTLAAKCLVNLADIS